MVGLCVALLAGAVRGGAGEAAGPVALPPLVDGLPEVLVEFPGGALRRGPFRERVGEWLRAGEWGVEFQHEFYHQIILRVVAAELGLPPPNEEVLDAQYAEVERENGGPEAFARLLAHAGRTPRDYRRIDVPAGYRALMIARAKDGLSVHARLPASFIPGFIRDQMAARPLVWQGWDVPLRVASVAGRDYSADELVSFAVQFAPAARLRPVFDDALRESVLVEEIARTGAKDVDALFAADLADAPVRRAYEEAKGDLALVAAWCAFLPFPADAPPPAPGSDADESARLEAVRARATILAAGGDFAARAKEYIEGPRHGRGHADFVGYLAGAEWVARFVPPDAYGLDRLPGGGNPVTVEPLPGLRAAALALRENAVSEPLRLRTGYAIVKRGAVRAAPSPEAAAPRVRAWRRALAMGRLFDGRLADARYHWTPEKR